MFKKVFVVGVALLSAFAIQHHQDGMAIWLLALGLILTQVIPEK